MEKQKQMQKKMGHWVPVVSGFLRKGNKVLLGQRPEKKYSNNWEFPGGKIKKGEIPEEALKRELFEELNINADVGRLKLVLSHFSEADFLLLIFYEIKSWNGELKALFHKDLKWVKKEDLHSLPMLEANKKFLNKILLSL